MCCCPDTLSRCAVRPSVLSCLLHVLAFCHGSWSGCVALLSLGFISSLPVGFLQRSSMGQVFGAQVATRTRGGDVPAEPLERKTVEKVPRIEYCHIMFLDPLNSEELPACQQKDGPV